jgi:hypothetical protein
VGVEGLELILRIEIRLEFQYSVQFSMDITSSKYCGFSRYFFCELVRLCFLSTDVFSRLNIMREMRN